MKKSVATCILTIAFLALTAFTARIISIFEQLKIAEQEAREYILADFTEGSLNFPYSEVLKKLAVNKKSEAVKEIGDYIRKFTESPEFEKEFRAIRENRLSGERPVKKNKEELLQEKILQIKEDIKTTGADMKSTSGDMKRLYEATLQQLRESLAALENTAHPKHKLYLADMIDQYEEEFKEKKFADPNLEAKSTEWKRCFRAGKETILAARSYAESWLASLK